MYRRAQEQRDAYQAAGRARRSAMRAYAGAFAAYEAGDEDRRDLLAARADMYDTREGAQRILMGDAGGMRAMPRAEPDQVVRSAARFDDGRFAGRYEGAVTTGMTEKVDVGAAGQPTNENST